MSATEGQSVPLSDRNPDGTVTVPTSDAGDVRVSCPSWCTVQHGYRHPPAKVEITHRSEPVWALADTLESGPVSMVETALVQWPYSGPRVYLGIEADHGNPAVGPTSARRIAAALRQHADHIDAMAERLEALRAGEDR